MSAKDSRLYGIPRAKKTTGKEIASSATLAFTSQLSSLVASSGKSNKDAPSRTVAGRSRPKKEDIFSTHNKNTKKRALKDLEDDGRDFAQKHSTKGENVDEATWHHAKRKMEEKSRLYAAMKRGDVEDLDEKYAVDFDRKWAEQQEAGKEGDTSSGEDDAESEVEEEVEYIDEFGRTRKGTRADAAREERRKRTLAADEPDRFTARPAMPTNIIYGDTVQAAAFNPDETIAEQMAELAKKRDKEDTPPPDEHFDSKKEIRTKGVGFFQFSADAEERKKQMEDLEKERQETERRRMETLKRKEDRKKEIEERRQAILQKRGKAKADKFLNDLMGEMGEKSGGTEKEQG
ncbi:hypothetical protein EJ08DRAFT_648137 [Tothia fuscella]|uniref:Uncharacterized protein n=1 Tax=Tothia fuscella TaxID=1048955 RepID=A0A9P4U047_9PEZI|nr:hypothetical protein EJ08DRAFT_648137 [Tothia fuscella]